MNKLSVSMTRSESIAGWIYLPLQLLPIPMIISIVNMIMGDPLSEAQLNFVYFCLNFLCLTVIFHRFILANLKNAFSEMGRTLLSAVSGYALYWGLAFAVSTFVLMVYPDFFNVNDDSISGMLAENRGLMIVGTVLLVPVAEELLYRGLVFRSLYGHSKFLAYAVSVVGFAALHIVNYIGQYDFFHLFLCFLQYLPAGICLGWAYVRADSIVAPILIHIFVNAMGILSM